MHKCDMFLKQVRLITNACINNENTVSYISFFNATFVYGMAYLIEL